MSPGREIIDIRPNGFVQLASGLNNFLTALSPLGTLSKTVGEIIACGVEIKRLHNEAQEIKLRYQVQSRQVDATLSIAVRYLEDRRRGMEQYFVFAEKQLAQQRIYSSQRIKVMQRMTELIGQSGISFEEKQLAHETIRVMSADLVEAQRAGSASLSMLVQTTQKNLLQVPSLTALLPDGSQR